jgi:hypothetical protein
VGVPVVCQHTSTDSMCADSSALIRCTDSSVLCCRCQCAQGIPELPQLLAYTAADVVHYAVDRWAHALSAGLLLHATLSRMAATRLPVEQPYFHL